MRVIPVASFLACPRNYGKRAGSLQLKSQQQVSALAPASKKQKLCLGLLRVLLLRFSAGKLGGVDRRIALQQSCQDSAEASSSFLLSPLSLCVRLTLAG